MVAFRPVLWFVYVPLRISNSFLLSRHILWAGRRSSYLPLRFLTMHGNQRNAHVKAYSDSYELKTLDMLDVDGAHKKVYYVDEGPPADLHVDVPLVIIGGTAQTANTFLSHIQAIRKKRRLVIIEMRGQGQTNLDSTRCTMQQLVEDFSVILSKLNISSVHLAGFSFGGRVALAFAATHPEIVTKLSITGVATLRPFLGKMILNSWTDALSRGNMRECAWSFLINGYSESFLNKHQSKIMPYLDLIISGNKQERLYDLLRCSHVTNDDDPFSVKRSAERVKCPVQIIAERYDRIAGHYEVLGLSEIISNSSCATFDTGHLVPFEDPVAWRKSILDFFN
jgi:pimeloyl-ACP methyl ester carboxylesterase